MVGAQPGASFVPCHASIAHARARTRLLCPCVACMLRVRPLSTPELSPHLPPPHPPPIPPPGQTGMHHRYDDLRL